MQKLSEKKGTSGGDLFSIMMVNAIIWAVAIIASVVILRDTRYYVRLFPILDGGACVAVVAVSITWRRRRQRSS